MNNTQSTVHPIHHGMSRGQSFIPYIKAHQARPFTQPASYQRPTPKIPSEAVSGLKALIRDGIFDVYTGLDLDHHTEGETEGSKSTLIIHRDFGKLMPLARIELMVEEIRATKELAFEITFDERGKILLIPKSLERHYRTVKAVLKDYSDQYVYSPRVEVFFEAAKELKLLSEDFSFGEPLQIDAASRWRYADLFNELISDIRDRCERSRFKTRLHRHERNAQRRKARGLLWEKEMFDWRSRHLFLMLCLNYKPSVRRSIKPEDVQRHLQRLLNNRRANRLLAGITGYIWKIEDGRKSGLHVHILIAYSTNRKADIKIAKRIGEYWRDVVTEGQGSYRNSNRDRRVHREKGHGEGTGQIDQSDVVRRQALRGNIVYLAKSGQHLRRKSGSKYRSFGMSQPPKKIVSGRPRLNTAQAASTSAL